MKAAFFKGDRAIQTKKLNLITGKPRIVRGELHTCKRKSVNTINLTNRRSFKNEERTHRASADQPRANHWVWGTVSCQIEL